MPRVTRAALRSNAVALDEPESAANVPLPLTPPKERTPFSEITGNAMEVTAQNTNTRNEQPKRKGNTKSKNRQGSRKAKMANAANKEEVIEDENHSAISSAVEDACEELRKDVGATTAQDDHETTSQVITDPGPPQDVSQDESCVPATAITAANLEEEPQSTITSTGSSDQAQGNLADKDGQKNEDSFLNVIETRTPINKTQSSALSGTKKAEGEMKESDSTNAQDANGTEVKEDSFVEQIVMRSPAKAVLRIEDSVEAIDAFEDEIEKIGEQLPTIDDAVSLAKLKGQTTETRNSSREGRNGHVTTSTKGKVEGVNSVHRTRGTSRSDTANLSCAGAPKTVRSTATKRVSSIHKAPFQPSKSTKPPTVSNFELPGDAVARKLKEQREARLGNGMERETKKGETKSQKVEINAPKPVKSKKPPTRASFILPGEAIAQKLKEKREERLKQQEVAAEPRKESKARPIRLSQGATVKSTATSKARISLVPREASGNPNSKPIPGIRPGSRATGSGSVAPSDAHKRLSHLSVPKRTPTSTKDTPAPRPSLADTTITTSRMSAATPLRRITSNGRAAAQHQTIRGKEVFERNKSAKDALDKSRKEKEEAAKRARAEAAERGRIASRQWAEKQKVRKASAGGKGHGEEGQAAAAAAATAA